MRITTGITIRVLCRKISNWFTLSRGVGYRCVQTLFTALQRLCHAILGNFGTDQLVIELTEISQ